MPGLGAKAAALLAAGERDSPMALKAKSKAEAMAKAQENGAEKVKRKRAEVAEQQPQDEAAKKKEKKKRSEGEAEVAKPKKKTPKAATAAAEPAAKKPKKIKDAAKAASDSASEEGSAGEPESDPLAVEKFAIHPSIRAALLAKGIKSLFPIQAQTFEIVRGGLDLVARARTGQGKTLAFVLPVLEKLFAAGESGKAYGRPPRVIVLAPTRELAKQVGADFELMGEAVKLKTVCVYGGAPMSTQESALRRGVDVVVGTPGRVKDLLQRGSLSLRSLEFRVLDEADEMLNMGFVDDVETILGAVDDVSTVQTLLFSATLPAWIHQIASRFFKPNKKTVDLVGEEKLKASASVKHLLLPCHWTQRNQVVTDLISCYSRGGRVIVFTETKNDATSLTEGLAHLGARPLHGDIAQNHRESTLAGFRVGAFQVLVATDVAARGLDINDVQLVIQCSPPQTEETYIHRSGRTGRAGATGVSVMLTGGKKDYMIDIITRKAGVKFERISVPQPADIARAAATNAASSIQGVADSVVPLFREAAEQLIQDAGIPALDVVAKALAKIAGQGDLKRRSLLTAHDDATTLYFKAPDTTIRTPTYVFGTLRRLLPQETVDKVRRMNLTVDGHGAVFDVPSELAQQFVDAVAGEEVVEGRAVVTLEMPDSLPELQTKPEKEGSSRFDGGGSRGGRGGFGGGGRGRRGDSGSRGRGGGSRGRGGGRGRR